ncbi:MAG: adenosylcobinamide-GDP ribazoletransferase [Oceanospirillaceae bacterium]|nr:adenosylcobinamide-GDP ribazoletransferase [Oceanospirillaceae bacterium]MEC8908789.1 adenosylcobinamide-GDP ribazoletransferase [Pseudomonadota bacterium]HCG78032.1 adenosylcobinamide-GDP ribazoletransferase [Oceanospirillales bacterium]MEC9409090.1 adenosylcobinamide-GDP ribazoletransferase [Pseudomonadota bacterium]MEE3160761.1 adenosylcobinamide-GDP ribazoletransferase [Pseudomonadota bacterium]|tara:strand:- start:804 stop:1565 length:762 start_codon:yes stop_codon:yes gene_type:complete
MNRLSEQLNLWWIAVAFFTRIPVPASVEFSQASLNRASRYFPAVGWLIGALCATALWLLMLVFPQDVAVLISIAISLLLTGCFHEDGLADTCDGLGGGWTREQKLSIMKDSRIGTYGAAALWVSLTLKFVVLSQLINPVLALLVAHPLSRIIPTVFIAAMSYVSDADTSKAKPLAESGSGADTAIAIITGLTALIFINNPFIILLVLLVLAGVAYVFLKRQIGGFTGDALGAVQQVGELAIYLSLLALSGSAS